MKAGTIVAFPGSGKTYFAKRANFVIDLDFGHFRTAMGKTKAQESTLLDRFAKMIDAYVDEGWCVLTNEPALIPLLKSKPLKVIVPATGTIAFERAGRKLDMTPAQLNLAIHSWMDVAEAAQVPVEELRGDLSRRYRSCVNDVPSYKKAQVSGEVTSADTAANAGDVKN